LESFSHGHDDKSINQSMKIFDFFFSLMIFFSYNYCSVHKQMCLGQIWITLSYSEGVDILMMTQTLLAYPHLPSQSQQHPEIHCFDPLIQKTNLVLSVNLESDSSGGNPKMISMDNFLWWLSHKMIFGG
jgi:hypothetical protein